MKALKLLLLSLFIGASTVVAMAQPTLLPPDAIRRGEPAFVVFLPGHGGQPAAGYTLTIRYADGRESLPYRGFKAPPGLPAAGQRAGGLDTAYAGTSASGAVRSAILFLVSVPTDAVPGDAAMVVFDPDGIAAVGARFAIVDRAFLHEDLRLDTALTSLRIDADPLKTEQAIRYQALLSTVDPAAAFLGGGFVKPVATERITSFFGMRRRYIYADGGIDSSTHSGVDYGCPRGTPVVAAGSGRVAMAEARIVTGNTVVIEHLPGAYTIYMHLDSMAVAAGDMVEAGTRIGAVGMTGLATGPHLHWEFRVMGAACDPEALVGLDKMPTIRTILPAIEGR
ncbi:MAG: M23 family peptidase [Spirochaetae bacterium HGW-Spirochaetae-7]|jgi:hypothetical protein|nr:MAG: M23 family peptidase [Spirochaetae bacterium HGW-Spirochaetae-7]